MKVSLTFLRRAIGLVLLAAVIAGVLLLAAPQAERLFARDGEVASRDLSDQVRIIVYRAENEESVTFAYSRPTSVARIISYPVISEGDWQASDGSYYTFSAQFYGEGEAPVYETSISLHATHPVATGERRRVLRRTRAVQGRNALADQTEIRVPQEFDRLVLTPLAADDGVVAVDFRAYEPRIYTNLSPGDAFRRREPRYKERRSEASAFPVDHLTRKEEDMLGRTAWRPVGPAGVAGRDYDILVLYEDREVVTPEFRQ